jgi:parallel beta-helix repeat protein
MSRKELKKVSNISGVVTNSVKKAWQILWMMSLILLLAVAPSVFLAKSAAAAQPVAIYVSPTGSDTTGNGSLAAPFATISHGVAAAPVGAAVIVAPGTYNEMVNITQQLTLESQSSQPSNTIIDASGLSMGIFVNGPSTAGTVVTGFTVENANDHGIYAQDTSNVLIEHNIATHNGVSPNAAFSGEDKAIEVVGTSNSTISGNTVVGNLYGGIAINDNGPINPGFYSPGTPNAAVGNVISGNTVIGNRPNHCAIVVSAYDAGEGVLNNIVSNNIVVDNSAGIIVAANTPNTAAVNNTVIRNTILNNGEGGVVLHSNSPGCVVTGNTIIGNIISGNGFQPPTTPELTGIIVGGEGPVPVQNTTIMDNVFHNQYYGIYVVNGTQNIVLSNTMDSTVTVPVYGALVSQDPLSLQISDLSNALSTLQTQLNQLEASAAKQSDLTTTSYIAYAALVLAIVLGGVAIAIAFSRRRPSPAK